MAVVEIYLDSYENDSYKTAKAKQENKHIQVKTTCVCYTTNNREIADKNKNLKNGSNLPNTTKLKNNDTKKEKVEDKDS